MSWERLATFGGGAWGRLTAAAQGDVLPTIARRSIRLALDRAGGRPPQPQGGYLSTRHGVFVTLRVGGGELRGCVGTLVPRCHDLVEETWRNARLAAFQDDRFAGVILSELADLHFEVSVLHALEDVSSILDLDPCRYGLVVSTDDGRRGALLPEVEGIDTVERQLEIARRKGAIAASERVHLQRFRADHFVEPPGGQPRTLTETFERINRTYRMGNRE